MSFVYYKQYSDTGEEWEIWQQNPDDESDPDRVATAKMDTLADAIVDCLNSVDNVLVDTVFTRITQAAREHGADSEPEHEVGDLQEALLLALMELSGDQLRYVSLACLGEVPEQAEISVRATAHSDDRKSEVDFDASPWFAQASDDEIRRLATCGWGGDEPADRVAMYVAVYDKGLADMFKYIGIARTQMNGDTMGFECYVAEEDVRRWLTEFRPHILDEMDK